MRLLGAPRTRATIGRPERATVAWVAVLAGLAGFRVALPLAVHAHAGSSLPLLPHYDGVLLNGDANGFFEAVSNIVDSSEAVLLPHWPLALVGLIAVWSAAVALAVLRPRRRWLALLAGALAPALVVAYVVHDVDPPGAAVVGWSVLWTVSLLGISEWRELDIGYAFDYALALSLAANALTTIATAYLGLYATGRRSIGLLAAALYAFWPVWIGLVVGEGAWENSQWHIDVGLHLYTEPASTALVVTGAALLLKPELRETRAAGAGLLLGYSAVVKLTNGLLAGVFLPLVAARFGLRRALAYGLGCLVFLPILVVYWPKGYVQIFDGSIAGVPTPWSLDYVTLTWRSSTMFTPGLLLLLGVPALAGVAFLRSWYGRLVVLSPIVVTAAVYSLYYATYLHPRFLFVLLPFVFVLVAAGVVSAFRIVWARGAAFGAGPKARGADV